MSAGVWLASKNEVLRYIDEAELPKCVNKDCDTSTEDNVRIRILKLVFTFKHNGVSIYSMKCFKINKELTFIITCIHLDHCATWVQHEFSSTRIARSRKLHLGNTVMASEKIWWILIDGSYNLFIGKYQVGSSFLITSFNFLVLMDLIIEKIFHPLKFVE